jgi:hypothetical protein
VVDQVGGRLPLVMEVAVVMVGLLMEGQGYGR